MSNNDMDVNDEGKLYSGETGWNPEWSKLTKQQLIQLLDEVLESRAIIWSNLDSVTRDKVHYGKQINEFSDAAKAAELKLAEREKYLAQQRKDDAARHERIVELKDQQIDRLTKERNEVTNQFDQVRFDPTCKQRVDMAKETLAELNKAQDDIHGLTEDQDSSVKVKHDYRIGQEPPAPDHRGWRQTLNENQYGTGYYNF